MFGNSGRSPAFPFQKVPYFMDTEDWLKFNRLHDRRIMEVIIMYQQMKFYQVYHPQREDRDDMTIYDAEHLSDINKRLEESRHDMAIKCV